MKQAVLAGILFLIVGIALGCGGTQKNPEFQPGPMPPNGNFDGVYQSDFGRLELTVAGNTVHGLFEDDQLFGRIQGKVEGRLLHFEWTQWTEDMQGRAREKSGRGVFKYIIDVVQTTSAPKEVHRLNGIWGYGKGEMPNVWNAYRLSNRAKKILKPRNMEPTREMPGAEDFDDNQGFNEGEQETPDDIPETQAEF